MARKSCSGLASPSPATGRHPRPNFEWRCSRAWRFQPFRTDTEGFRAALSALADRPYDRVSAELTKLEDTGVILRRGSSLRIVPDLLGDALLEQAMFNR